MSPDDITLLLAAFRAARSSRSRWTRDLIGPCGREPGTRYWTCDRDSSIGLDVHGHLTTAISGVDCHSVEDAVNHLVDVGVLPVELHSAYRAGRRAAAAAIKQMPHELGDEGWNTLAGQAEEAGYPREYVLRYRRRDRSTGTINIEAAYQYGYRTAAQVARG